MLLNATFSDFYYFASRTCSRSAKPAKYPPWLSSVLMYMPSERIEHKGFIDRLKNRVSLCKNLQAVREKNERSFVRKNHLL